MKAPKGPVVIDADALPDVPEGPADAAPVPEADALPEGAAMLRLARAAGAPPSPFRRLVLWALAALVTMALGLWAWDFGAGLYARNLWLGRVGLGLGAVVGLGLLALVLRELAAVARLRRIDGYQMRARDPAAQEDRAVALALSRAIAGFYAGREELRLARQGLSARQDEILDADALLAETEKGLLGPLDAQARREIELAARQVAAATALVPLALADVVIALAANIRMIRRVAEIYGGRAGTFGSWRLLRAVAQHLIATGAVAVGDDLIGSVAGGGVLSKVSRRFGEGVVNGALTARVGIAAMEVCRPMPFAALPRPRVTRLIQRALVGLFQAG